MAEEAEAAVYWLDARNVEPSAGSFIEAVRRSAEMDGEGDLFEYFARQDGTVVLLLDTCEHLECLDRWLREDFLPDLPTNVVVVLSGRREWSSSWRIDPGLQSVVRWIRLRNLDREAAREYLSRRGIPGDRCEQIFRFSYGHPLALALAADALERRPDTEVEDLRQNGVIEVLVRRFLEEATTPDERRAVQAAALVRSLSESLLRRMLACDDAYDLYRWLQSLSFIGHGPDGLVVHDLARDTISAELRQRDPETYRSIHAGARSFYNERLKTASSAEYEQILTEYIYLHRDNPVVRPVFKQLQGEDRSGGLSKRPATDADREEVVAMVRKHEGRAAAEVARRWFDHDAAQVDVYGSHQRVEGLLITVELRDLSPQDRNADPAVDQALTYLKEHAPLRRGEKAVQFRFWMADETYQDVSRVQGLIFVHMVQTYLCTRGLAFSFLPCADAGKWALIMAYADIDRLPAADYVVDGQEFGMFGHDWRVMPPSAWLDVLAEREIGGTGASNAENRPQPELMVLSAEAFAEALKEALEQFTRPDALRESPLLRSRLVLGSEDSTADQTAEQKLDKLRNLILTTAESLSASPKEAKYYRALKHTYFEPEVTQERASEKLGIPFSTYRRHLQNGIELVTESLWRRETAQ